MYLQTELKIGRSRLVSSSITTERKLFVVRVGVGKIWGGRSSFHPDCRENNNRFRFHRLNRFQDLTDRTLGLLELHPLPTLLIEMMRLFLQALENITWLTLENLFTFEVLLKLLDSVASSKRVAGFIDCLFL